MKSEFLRSQGAFFNQGKRESDLGVKQGEFDRIWHWVLLFGFQLYSI